MSSKVITLFDLAKQGDLRCWSPNVWKARLALNYKGLAYQTTFLDNTQIQSTLRDVGLSPNVHTPGAPPPLAAFTVPAIRCPLDDSCVMDSLKIAEKLESLLPSPSLHLDTGLHLKALQVLGQACLPIMGVFMPAIGRNIIPEVAKTEWYAHKQGRFGMPMDEFEKVKGGPAAWEAAQPHIDALVDFLKTHKKDDGPFVLGSQVSFADFVIVGILKAFDMIQKEIFDQFVGDRVELLELYKACQPWLERDN